MPVRAYDADLTHPWAQRWRIPRVTNSYPRWQYEVAVVIPTPGDTLLLDGVLTEPSEREAEIIGSFINYRRAYYYEHWSARMLAEPFDVDDSTNTVILAKSVAGWQYRRATFQHGLWPFWNDPTTQAQFPPTTAGLRTLLDHINHNGQRWAQWKTDHPAVFTD
ncbi:hypothetical protein [Nocardia asiatica]|uniref:hypothetical protein n=1 Tax=Nocardia asiatica TaxID=209252 RepID=UPI0024544263|nr:hypothetical protein [Nocardia asiatica]